MRFAVVSIGAAVAALALAVALAGARASEGMDQRESVATAGYTFDTGVVKLAYGANESYWRTAHAQGTFCGGQPLGEPWHVWGRYVQYIEGEPTVNPFPADGTATFGSDGKQVARSQTFPWWINEIQLRLNESPPKASIWFWNGQLVSREEVVVELKPNPQCTVTVVVRTLDCTPEPGVAGKRLTGKATVVVSRGGKPATLAPTAKVVWGAKVGTVVLRPLSTARAGNVLRATWKLPKTVKTKVVKVTVTVTSDGVTATKTHLHRVA